MSPALHPYWVNPMVGSDHRLALPVGYRFAEYSIIKVLGQGGFGITYLARDTLLNVDVAIKELLPRDSATRIDGVTVVPKRPSDAPSFAWAKQRFISEARILASLRHENIVHVYRFLEMHGTAYMVMEFVQGENLSDWLRRHRKRTEQILHGILFPLLDGLDCVHRKNVLHRDISPENILITAEGRPMLLDFGSARTTVDGDRKLTGVVRAGYSPIEQYQTDAPQGPYTDIYALAGVMVYAITGHAPPLSMDRCGSEDSYEPLARRYRGTYGASFLWALDEGFSVAPQDRPQTVSEWRKMLVGDLKKVKAKPKPKPLRDEPKRRESKPPARLDRATKKRTALLWMAALVLLALVAGGASWYYVMNGASGGSDATNGSKSPPAVASGGSKPSSTAIRNEPYTNFLGMKFVPVPGTRVLFCIDQTRRKDYAAYALASANVSRDWGHAAFDGVPVGDAPDDPVVMVSWNEANSFCQWLSETDSKRMGSPVTYRLATWEEWRVARGTDQYPWGNDQSPPKGAGNFADRTAHARFGGNFPVTPNYDDGFATTAPVGSFAANRFGLYDLGSNVQEWSADRDISSGEMLVLGTSWKDPASNSIYSREAPQYHESVDSRRPFIGFRCVLVLP